MVVAPTLHLTDRIHRFGHLADVASGALRRALWTMGVVLCWLSGATAWSQEVSATIDRTQIYENETVLLTISVSDVASVDIGLPETDDFRIVGTQTSTSMTMSGRTRQVTTQRAYRLAPLRTGTLTFGGVLVRGASGAERTDTFVVNVLPAAPGSAGSPPAPARPSTGTTSRPVAHDHTTPPPEGAAPQAPGPLSPNMYTVAQVPGAAHEPFVVTKLNRDAAIVGEPLIVDYLLALPLDIFDAELREYEEPSFASAWFRDVSDARRRMMRGNDILRTDDGRTYRLRHLVSFVVVPLQEGPWTLPALNLEVVMSTLRGRYPPRAIASPRVLLPVEARPTTGRPRGYEGGNTGWLQVETTVDRTQLRVGESLIVQVHVQGIAHAPEVRVPMVSVPEGLRALESTVTSDTEVTREGWLFASVRRRTPLVAEAEGRWTIPGVRVAFYDPWAGAWHTRETDAIEVVVEGTSQPATRDDRDYLATGAWIEDLPNARPLGPPREITNWWRAPWYTPVVAAPPVYLFVTWLAARMRRHRREPTREERIDTQRTLLRDLLASTPSPGAMQAGQLAVLLRAWAGTVIDAPLGGARVAELQARVATVWPTERAERFARLIAALEEARYAGEDAIHEYWSDADQFVNEVDA
jgi:hypothetical protein